MAIAIPKRMSKGLINGLILNVQISELQPRIKKRRRKHHSLSNQDALSTMQQLHKCRPEFKCCVSQLMRMQLRLSQFVSKLWQYSKEQLKAHRRQTR